jgi:hypothetical protein
VSDASASDGGVNGVPFYVPVHCRHDGKRVGLGRVKRRRGAGLCVHALTCARACVQGATAPVGLGEDADCASANCAYIASPAVRIRGAPAVRTACGGVNTTPVPAQMRHGRAQSRRRRGTSARSPGADVAGGEPSPGTDVARPSPVQMWWEGAQGTCVKRLAQGRSRVRANVMPAFDLLFCLPAGLFPGGPRGQPSRAPQRPQHRR